MTLTQSTQKSTEQSAAFKHDIIVIGASAGGVEALADLAARLPTDLPAAVFIVLHVPAYGTSVLPSILSRRGPLPAAHPVNEEDIRPGHIYIAPPDHHMIVRDGKVFLTRGPAENGHRPAVDTLFRSAARSYGPRVLGVVLTGTLDDGTAGLQAIKIRGGVALAQDPDEALFGSMPRSAIENVAVDFVQPLAALAETLVRLTRQPTAGRRDIMPEQAGIEGQPIVETQPELEIEVGVAEFDMPAIEAPRLGQPSPYACPDCQGVLWEVQDGELLRFRCRVGHAFSPESLLAAQSENLESALWVALRALEESAALTKRLQVRAEERGHGLAAKRFADQAGDAHRRADIIREALTSGQIIAETGPPAVEENVYSAPTPGALRAGTALPPSTESDPH